MTDGGSEQQDGARQGPSLWRIAPLLVLLLAAVAAVSALAFRHSSSTTLPDGAHEAAPGDGYWGTLALPRKAAPATELRDSLGRPTTIAQFHGKVVLVTFLYTHCPDICPLITANLRVVLSRLGAGASRVQVVAISTDPRGDTPETVRSFLAAHEMTGRMRYLLGGAGELAGVWKAWGVGSEREAANPELVAHTALVYGISASGRITTIYPSSFEPAQIVHDVPRLAAG